MTKETINASDVIGQSYYIYNLSPSNNNPSINSTINITCTVTNVYGQAVSGKSITLSQNGTSKGSQNTSSNGTASWNNISMTSEGLNVFNVENTKIEVYVDNKISKSSTTGLVKNDGTIDTSTYLTQLKIGSTSGLPVKTGSNGVLTTGSFGTSSGTFAEGNHTHSAYVNPTKVTSWSSTPSDSNVASEKLIKDSLDGKQQTLISGTNIKTINNNSLLGSGNIDIQGGSSITVDTAISTVSNKQVQNKAIGLEFRKLGDYDEAYDYYGGIVKINDNYGSNDLEMMSGRLIYSNDEDKLCYDKTNVATLDELATMGDIPSLTNYVQKSGTVGIIKNDGTIMTSGTGASNYATGNHTHSGYVSATKVTSWQSTTSDSNVPSEKLVKDTIDDLVGLVGEAIQYIQQ